ncbi:MAG: putative inorganic carbon transporter subunit DabA, partial [Cocleimonas sp.]
TGLPLQMIEIHEPMRLQLMVEAKTETLTKIYQNQPSIQELVGNGWVLLSAKDPDSEKIHTFNPEKGWELWEDGFASMPSGGNNNEQNENKVVTINKSQDWYSESYDHLPAALIETVNTRTR